MKATRVAFLLFLVPFVLLAQDRFGAEVNVTAIELTVDVRDASGNVPQDLKPDDFVVIENGVERPVSALEYLRNARVESGTFAGETRSNAASSATNARDANLVIFFDLEQSHSQSAHASAKALAELAPRLIELGAVDVVVSDPETRWLVRGTTDAQQLAAALHSVESLTSHERQAALRRDYVARVRQSSDGGSPAMMKMRLAEARMAIAEEDMHIRRFNSRLIALLSKYPRRSVNTLLLVADGFDLDPAEFYGPMVSGSKSIDTSQVDDEQRLVGETSHSRAQRNEELAREIAAAGWTVSSFTGGQQAYFIDDASTSGHGKLSSFNADTSQTSASGFLLTHPRDPLHAFAESTGGSVVTLPANFATAIQSLGDRIRITYELPRKIDAAPHKVEVRAKRRGLKVRASRWTSSSTPELTASARALEQLDGGGSIANGELPVTARLQIESDARKGRRGTLEVRVGLESLEALRAQLKSSALRATIAVEAPNRPATVVHQTVDKYDLSKLQRVLFTAPMELDQDASRVSVVMEELTTGAWGATIIALTPASQKTFASKGWGEESQPARESDGIAWLSWADGLARAQAEKKLLFLDLGQSTICLGCSSGDRSAFRHPAFQRAMTSSFVPVLAPKELAQSYKNDRVAVADPWGRIRFAWSSRDVTELLARLALIGRYEEPLVRAGAALNGAQPPDAFFTLGYVYAQTGEPQLARENYTRARELAAARDPAFAQRAQIHLALLDARSGSRDAAQQTLDRIIAAPANPANAAEALIVLGNIKKTHGDAKGATEAFSQAAVRAPKGSELERIALALSGADVAPVALSSSASNSAPALKPIQLVRPNGTLLSGRTRFQTLVRDARVDKVVFSLDEHVVETVNTPPFSARIDLGSDARSHAIHVQALGRDGKPIGDDTLRVNERHDLFGIRITSPRGGSVSGTTHVSLDIQRPADATLTAVDLYWNEEKKATLQSAPYETDLALPSGVGSLRAVATLADGRTAQDAVTLNLSGYSENVDVELVEMYVRVNDAKGQPMANLPPSAFTLLDRGVPQEVVRAEFIDRPPLRIGVALDTSPSMREELPDAQLAAEDFLRTAITSNAQAFVVRFDDAPHLLHESSSDIESLTSRIGLVRPSGMRTAMYDALMFALLQFEDVPGKKALVVVSDAEDSSSRYSAEDVVAFAKKLGVSIYAIVLKSVTRASTVPRRVDEKRDYRRELNALTGETGGEVFFLASGHNLPAVYREIDDRLGGHYVVTFRPVATNRKAGEYRPIEVRVNAPGARVVGPSGYEVP
ncbi:MAG TPA: VWA domain-containing protein [Thermoanaerobaculia bacterium]|nr:VWA domain-containing protein [Thermoanaerobaculia bacterium]